MQAVGKLKTRLDDSRVSYIYATKPWGNQDQPEFLNLCMSGKTSLTAMELFKFTSSIEKQLGRTKKEKWGPREIDIDILFYGDEVIKTQNLKIPHPFIAERAFVLVPLAEIAPDFVHPVLRLTASKLASAIDTSGVRIFSDEKI